MRTVKPCYFLQRAISCSVIFTKTSKLPLSVFYTVYKIDMIIMKNKSYILLIIILFFFEGLAFSLFFFSLFLVCTVLASLIPRTITVFQYSGIPGIGPGIQRLRIHMVKSGHDTKMTSNKVKSITFTTLPQRVLALTICYCGFYKCVQVKYRCY